MPEIPSTQPSNGSLLLASTPNGRQGFRYGVVTDEDESWLRIRVPWTQCSRISPEFIEEQRRTHGPRFISAEFECVFADATNQYFSDEAIDVVLDPTLQRLHLTF